jgi:putative ABC transport system permease protein
MPFAFDRAHGNDGPHLFVVFGRLKPAITVQQAEAEMKAIVHQLQVEYPTVDPGMSARVNELHEERVHHLRPALYFLLAAAGFVLLIACLNVANLLLARATAREKEIAVRASLGAGRSRLIRQLVTESALLALLGGAVGLGIAAAGLRLLPTFLPPLGSRYEIPYIQSIHTDRTVLGFALFVSLATGILFGSAPAFQSSRVQLSDTLKEGGRESAGSRRGHRVRDLLVISEVTLSVLLLIGAGVLIRSFLNATSEKLGYDPKNLLTAQVRLPAYRYNKSFQFREFFKRLSEQVSTLPGVDSAGMVNFLPLSGWTAFFEFDIEGRPPRRKGEEFTAETRAIDANYLRTMGIPLLSGRGFMPADDEQASGVALINEALRRRYWPNEDPIGQHIRFLPEAKNAYEPELRDSWLTIVGVVGDTKESQFEEKKTGMLYVPYLQNPAPIMFLVLRTPSDPVSSAAAVRHAVELVDKDQPVAEVKTMEEIVETMASRERLNVALVMLFAFLATALAAIGIYGVMSYTVAQQTHDIGIRMALGAQPRDVLRLVVRQGMRLAVFGIGLGLIIGLGVERRVLASFLYGVTAADPLTLAGTILVLAVVALAACYIPARRATRVDPLVALRHE